MAPRPARPIHCRARGTHAPARNRTRRVGARVVVHRVVRRVSPRTRLAALVPDATPTLLRLRNPHAPTSRHTTSTPWSVWTARRRSVAFAPSANPPRSSARTTTPASRDSATRNRPSPSPTNTPVGNRRTSDRKSSERWKSTRGNNARRRHRLANSPSAEPPPPPPGHGSESRGFRGNAGPRRTRRRRRSRRRSTAAAAVAKQRAAEALEPVDQVAAYFVRSSTSGERELGEQARALDSHRGGAQAVANARLCRAHMKPLFKRIKRRELPGDIERALFLVVRAMKARDYRKAADVYVGVAIGNAAWPIGVTMVGIHERSAREKIGAQTQAHAMHDEETRKYLQSVKRLITFAQRRYPTTPSLSLDFNSGFNGWDKEALAAADARWTYARRCRRSWHCRKARTDEGRTGGRRRRATRGRGRVCSRTRMTEKRRTSTPSPPRRTPSWRGIRPCTTIRVDTSRKSRDEGAHGERRRKGRSVGVRGIRGTSFRDCPASPRTSQEGGDSRWGGDVSIGICDTHS